MFRVFICLTFLHIALSDTDVGNDTVNFTDLTPMALSGPPIVVDSGDICPSDSQAVDGVCKCNLDLCEAPPCDMFLHLVRNGTDSPGNCCPLYTCDNCTSETIENGTCACGAEAFLNDKGRCECIDHHKSFIDDVCVCDPDKCELPLFCDKHSVPIRVKDGCCFITHCRTCPEDSYPTDFQSDEIEDKCVCFPCPEVQCNDTHVPQILRKGRNVPQQCCDLYKCIPKETPEQECLVNDITYTNGERWINQDEQNCTCINGIPLCNEQYATDILVKHCLVNNTAYPHLATWQEDTCTNCTCYDGAQKCITHLCNITESKVKKYVDCLYNGHTYNHSVIWIAEDSCTNCTCNNGVPNCDMQACNASVLDATNNNNCPPLDNCKRFCKNGFKLNKRGCEICKCKMPEKIVEKYILLEMYMKDRNLSEADVLELLSQKVTQKEEQSHATKTSTPPDQSKDCEIMSYLLSFLALVCGILLGYFLHFLWKRKNSCDYRPVSKTIDNNNLPTQGNIKYISEKSPLKT